MKEQVKRGGKGRDGGTQNEPQKVKRKASPFSSSTHAGRHN